MSFQELAGHAVGLKLTPTSLCLLGFAFDDLHSETAETPRSHRPRMLHTSVSSLVLQMPRQHGTIPTCLEPSAVVFKSDDKRFPTSANATPNPQSWSQPSICKFPSFPVVSKVLVRVKFRAVLHSARITRCSTEQQSFGLCNIWAAAVTTNPSVRQRGHGILLANAVSHSVRLHLHMVRDVVFKPHRCSRSSWDMKGLPRLFRFRRAESDESERLVAQ